MIQGVEIFNPKFQADALGYRCCLGQRHVDIRQVRPAKDVSSEAVGAVPWIIDRIKLRETRVCTAVVGVVLQWNIGKTIGIENNASDGSDRLSS